MTEFLCACVRVAALAAALIAAAPTLARSQTTPPSSTQKLHGTIAKISPHALVLVVNDRGGRQTVAVPSDAPVVYLSPGEHKLLKRGMAVLVFADRSKKSEWVALSLIAGKDGVVPPM